MRHIATWLFIYFMLGASACGDLNYKQQSTTGAGSYIDNYDPDGSIIVEAQDDARVVAGNAATGNDQREEIGGVPLNPVSNVDGFTTDPCKDAAGNPVSGKTCAGRSIDLSDK